jgi:release factor glutamine methyltransferase
MPSPQPSARTVVARLRAAGCVFAEDEARLLRAHARDAADLDVLAARRAAGTPLEVLLGCAEFAGLRIAVEAGVFVPRRRTELLVREAAARCGPGAVVVDLCCGSGAVGAALIARVNSIELHAADAEPTAVRCARENLAATGRVYEGDLYGALPGTLAGRVDVLVANTPYVPTGEIELMPPEARLHEPRAALDGGVDGLDPGRRVAAGAGEWLAPGGQVLIETSRRQAPELAGVFGCHGLVPHVAESEELGATVVVGTLSRAPASGASPTGSSPRGPRRECR